MVYAFYITEHGENTFTEEQIKEQYDKSGRKTEQRLKNLTNSITSLLNKGFIKVHNDLEYRIKETGLTHVQNIFQGKTKTTKVTSNKPIKEKKKKKESSSLPNEKKIKSKAKPASGFKVLTDLNYRPKDEISLIDFFNGLPFESNPERILGIVWYCKEKLKIEK